MALRPRHRAAPALNVPRRPPATRPPAARWGPLALALVLLAGCASGPPPPDWQLQAQGAAARATEAWLDGFDAVAEVDFRRAQRELARTGRPEALARLALLRCAARVAALDLAPCDWPGLDEAHVAHDLGAPERAYARYLAGRATPDDAPALPQVHRPWVAEGGAAQAAARLAAIEAPLSRLVVASVLVRRGLADDAVVQVAVDTAAAQGWRRALAAWLGHARDRATQAGDAEAAARHARRLQLVAPEGAR